MNGQASNQKPVLITEDGRFNSRAFDEDIKLRLHEIIDKHPLDKVKEFIETEMANQTQDTSFNYSFKCFPEDGAFALYRAIQKLEGYSRQKESGPSNNPPETIDVKFADGNRIKVPWGEIAIPSLGKSAYIEMSYDKSNFTFHISGVCQKRFVRLMDDIMTQTQDFLDNDSIYRGRAIKLDSNLNPTFLNLSKVQDVPMFMAEETEFALRPIVSRLENPQTCLDNNLELKFGALLSGEYGTGKTLLAFKLAFKAIHNDWGFIYLTDPTKTVQMLEIANHLSTNGRGFLTFVEDIDLVITKERSKDMNKILNIIDGGDTKGNNIISIFTTNHLERIDPTFLRGKRIGSLINMSSLDKATAKNFINEYLGKSVKGQDISNATEMIEEMKIVPAFLAEILDRVKANMIYTKTSKVTEDDIINSIKSYEAQINMARVKADSDSPIERLANAIDEVFIKKNLEKLDLI